jgi:SAM-dependent methyltransferase
VTSSFLPDRELAPRDPAGAETLEILRAAPRYNAWQFRRISSYLGRRICEIGSGIGNMSGLLRQRDPELLLLTDTDPFYRGLLARKYQRDPAVAVEALTLPDAAAAARLGHYRVDTVVALNVIEHIADDVGAIQSVAQMLPRGGRAVILVPALPVLYGSLDRQLGHARRYTRDSLARLMIDGGLRLQTLFFFNMLGALGWWYYARIRQIPQIPLRELRLFNSLVPVLRLEDMVPRPFGQSLIAVGVRDE